MITITIKIYNIKFTVLELDNKKIVFVPDQIEYF